MQSSPCTNPFLTGGGAAGAILRSLKWSDSPLGDIATWPASLSTVLALILQSKFPMFLAWGPQLVFFYNDAYAEILGARHPAAMGARFPDIWREIWPEVAPIVEQALAGTATYHENACFSLHRNGSMQDAWFTFSYSPLLGADSQVQGMFCVCAETTAQVHASRDRAEENQRLCRLFQQAPGVIAHTSGPSHVFELANDAFLRLIGKSDVLGMSVAEALPELAEPGLHALLDRVYASGTPFLGKDMPVYLQRSANAQPEQRFVSLIFQPVVDRLGRVTGIFVEGSDVTDAVLAQAAVRENEKRLRQLASTIPHLAWMAERDGVPHWYNARWYEYTGTTLAHMIAKGWGSVVHPDDLAAAEQQWRASVATGAPYEIKARIRAADGAYHMFFIRAAALLDDAGNVLRWFGTNTDVTPLQQAQSELKAASARKDQFLAMLAHELRNPLAPISTAAQLLTRTQSDPALVQKASVIIARQAAHMTALLDDLLDVSRVKRGRISLKNELLDMQDVLQDALEQAQVHFTGQRQVVHTSLPETPCPVRGDRTRLIQVFSNLLDNASKYTPAAGDIFLSLHATDEMVTVEIRDSGIGIPATLLPYIFELFAQGERTPDRPQGGLGLGLSLVRQLVELQGGDVTASSAGAGQGSSFVVRFARAGDTLAAPGMVSGAAPALNVPRADGAV